MKKLIARAIDRDTETDLMKVFALDDGKHWRIEFPPVVELPSAQEYDTLSDAMRKTLVGNAVPVPESDEAREWLLANDPRLKSKYPVEPRPAKGWARSGRCRFQNDPLNFFPLPRGAISCIMPDA